MLRVIGVSNWELWDSPGLTQAGQRMDFEIDCWFYLVVLWFDGLTTNIRRTMIDWILD